MKSGKTAIPHGINTVRNDATGEVKYMCNHTPRPAGQVDHSDWAHEMLKTHNQTPCPSCGLLAVWVPKSKGDV